MAKTVNRVLLAAVNVLTLLLILAPGVWMVSQNTSLLASLLPGGIGKQETISENEGSDGRLSFSELLLSPAATSQAEGLMRSQLKAFSTLERYQVELKRFSGQQLQEGIFLTEDAMYENIPAPNDEITQKNINGMLELVYRYYIPTYTAIVPTACAIKQNDIPPAASLFNQKAYIDSIYRSISGVITSVDVYSSLFAAKDEYIYYRTHPELTGLGGYYLFTVLADKMSIKPRTLAQFEQHYLSHNFYGELYDRIQYPRVTPDIISCYRISLFSREYSMTRHNSDGTIHRYDDFLVPEILEKGEGNLTDAILGGPAPIINMKIDSPYREKLLIFGDETVKSYIPFLAAEYNEITIVDLSLISEKQLKSLSLYRYDQILFSYSLDTFSQVDFEEKLLSLAR